MKQLFTHQALRQGADVATANRLWQSLEEAYKSKDRLFHNLTHIEHLLKELEVIKHKIDDWETLVFSVFYHDAVYDVLQNVVQADNEERSAALAEEELSTIGLPAGKIEICKQHILATKTHLPADNNDTNFLVDADLCILGQPIAAYTIYKDAIREEFFVYRESVYNIGRIKVLESFLERDRLFKTDHFYELYEEQARHNMRWEIKQLQT